MNCWRVAVLFLLVFFRVCQGTVELTHPPTSPPAHSRFATTNPGRSLVSPDWLFLGLKFFARKQQPITDTTRISVSYIISMDFFFVWNLRSLCVLWRLLSLASVSCSFMFRVYQFGYNWHFLGLRRKLLSTKWRCCAGNKDKYSRHKENFSKHFLGDKQMMNVSPRMICTAVTCAGP